MWKTSDTQVAAYLLTLGHSLLRIEGTHRRRAFVFAPEAAADHLSYFQDTHPVSARKLFDSYRHLKGLLFTANQ